MAETIAVFRDISIIVLAMLSITLIVMLLVIAIIIWRMITRVAHEAPEFYDKAKAMTATAQGTIDFVGTTVARPAIAATAFLAGFQRFLEVIAMGNRKRPAKPPTDGSTEVRQ